MAELKDRLSEGRPLKLLFLLLLGEERLPEWLLLLIWERLSEARPLITTNYQVPAWISGFRAA
jgi:hypothetical protein